MPGSNGTAGLCFGLQPGALVWGSAGAMPRSGGTRAGCGKRSCGEPGEGWAAAEVEGGLQAACTRAALSPSLSAGCGHGDAFVINASVFKIGL